MDSCQSLMKGARSMIDRKEGHSCRILLPLHPLRQTDKQQTDRQIDMHYTDRQTDKQHKTVVPGETLFDVKEGGYFVYSPVSAQ